MKKLTAAIILMIALSCQKEEIDCGCVEKNPDNRACYEIYRPVCGCNGKTYPNDCYAEAAGIPRYTPGPCKSGKQVFK